MKTAIDSYCYHRYFGEVYPQQPAPPSRMTLEEFLHRASELQVDGVSLESCFIPSLDAGYLTQVRDLLDEYKLDRVFAWAIPTAGGRSESECVSRDDPLLRIGAAHRREGHARGRQQPHVPQSAARAADQVPDRDVSQAVKVAGTTTSGWRSKTTSISPRMKCSVAHRGRFSLARHQLRYGQLPAPAGRPDQGHGQTSAYVYATHIKDLKMQKGVAADEWYFFSCTPVGEGVVDNRKLAQCSPKPATKVCWRWRSTFCIPTTATTKIRQ